MRVIFLDVDGVLNRWGTATVAHGYVGVEPELVARFRQLVADCEAHVVLSSTWRLIPELREHVTERIPVIGMTPELGESRGAEIGQWLREHPEVTEYAIVDDDRDMLVGQHAFFTDYETGLTEEVVAQVRAHFGVDA